ncbi:hypothetical protein DN730_09905 [Marinomonas piezotolerans]|uniref:Uncharacterized protein n=1 Tax=Marinomonas piezotolerans TaxID=2213058 RepID=A0A370UA78_9GAMM|nr:hypothetical protein [Marinomonas piezotolerans]RDL44689.1 hypothetical protein DN730_09905 [Marinomonas piezotolerans]
MVTINPDSKLVPTWYQSKLDKNDPIEWLLKPLTGMEFMQVQSGARMTEEGGIVYSAQAQRDAMRFAIRDWKGVQHEQTSEPIEYSYYLLETLPSQYLIEVFREIADRAMLREYERKNSSSQSQSTATQSNSTAAAVSGAGTAIGATQPQ